VEKIYSYTITAVARKGDEVIQTVELTNHLLDYENLVSLETAVGAAVLGALGSLGQQKLKGKK